MKRPARGRRSRRGTTTVEFAFVAPALVLFILGAVAFGGLIMAQNVLTAAAADGARVASLRGATAAQVVAAVESRLSKGVLDPADVTITLTPSDPSSVPAGGNVKVEVSVPATDLTWVVYSLLNLEFSVASDASYVKE